MKTTKQLTEQYNNPSLSLPERIMVWCEREFNAKYVDRVFNEMIEYATSGNGYSKFTNDAVTRIMNHHDKVRGNS